MKILIFTGIVLIIALALLIVGAIVQLRRNDKILKEIDEFLENQ